MDNLKEKMRHALIRKKAVFIDQFVDNYRRIRKRKTFPHREVAVIIQLLFPGASYSGRGAFKTVHKVSTRAKDLVLKTSNRTNIQNDERAYKRIPQNIRNRYFAKVYWRTKYCLLQKYGRSFNAPPEKLRKLKVIANKYRLTDVRPANVRKVGTQFKIVDASLSNRKR